MLTGRCVRVIERQEVNVAENDNANHYACALNVNDENWNVFENVFKSLWKFHKEKGGKV